MSKVGKWDGITGNTEIKEWVRQMWQFLMSLSRRNLVQGKKTVRSIQR